MSEEPGHESVDAATRAQLIYAFRRIFNPLARILQRAGVPYYEFRDILKAAYIDAAIRDGIPGYPERPSTAAVACLLGVPEADIGNLVDHPDLLEPPQQTTTGLISAILTKWSTDNNYQGPYGLPQQLALSSPAGRSFSDLVQSVDPDASPAQVWEEMLINGTMESVGSHHVRMSGRQLVFGPHMTGNLYEALGRAMEDLAATMNHNQNSSSSDKVFQRSVFSDRPLPLSKIEEFSQLVREVMHESMIEIDDWLTKTTEEPTAEESIDVGVTIFEYRRTPIRKVPLKDLITEAPSDLVPAWIQVSGVSAK